MKSLPTALALAAAISTASFTAQADPAAFVGLSYSFGGNVGLSLKVLSDDEEGKNVAALGGTYYFGAQNPWGLDLGVGRTFDNGAVTIGWDFLQENGQISAGWADTEDDNSSESDEMVYLMPTS